MADRPPPTDPRLETIDRLVHTDRPRAAQLAGQALADGVDAPWLNAVIGLALKSEGRFDEAILAIGKAIEHDPGNAYLITLVGQCLLELDRRHEAAQVLGEAVRMDPNSVATLVAYGAAAERLGALDQAQSNWERAISLEPDRADALAGLSSLAARRGDWQTATNLAERASALDPVNTDARMNMVRIDIGTRRFDSAERRLTDLLSGDALRSGERARARMLLGDALDGAARYGEAYTAYAEGNKALRDLSAPRLRSDDRPTPPEVVRAMTAEFLETTAESWSAPVRQPAPGPARGHAFLMGFPRSGTTLMEQVIATHPDMDALGERPAMIDADAEFMRRAGGIRRLAETVSDLLAAYRDSYWRRVREFGVQPDGKVVVDKHPLGAIRLPLIAKLFPSAQIIFAERDPRDVVLSCFRRAFNVNHSMYEFTELEAAARYYDAVMSAADTFLARLPLPVLRLRYEALVTDFEGEARKLCDFLGVSWTPALRDFVTTKRAIATPSSTQIARGLYREGVGQWRNYAVQLAPVLPILQPWVDRFGYPAE